ncbi:MAG TPA: acetylesterase [Treponema sp.]|nr:acetylesterase [Treponema sp.]
MILRGDFSSEVLRVSTNIQILAPDSGEGPYRVVYLFHGMHGNQGTWINNTMLPIFAKKYNAIFVMPEVCRSFYIDLKYGRKYYTYVSEELPKVCRKFFNISHRREDSAVMGCSMGGFGALYLALSKPEQYGFCGAISSACLSPKPMLDALRKDPEPWLKTGPEANEIFVDLKSIYGDELEYNAEYDILKRIKDFPSGASKPEIYAACGTEDDLRSDSLSLRDTMTNTGFDFTYEEWTGDHDWYFFSDALKKAIEHWYK